MLSKHEISQIRYYLQGVGDQMASSSFALVLWDEREPPELVFQIGLAVVKSKPILVCVPKGVTIPPGLSKVANDIVDMGEDPFSPESKAKIEAKVREFIHKHSVV